MLRVGNWRQAVLEMVQNKAPVWASLKLMNINKDPEIIYGAAYARQRRELFEGSGGAAETEARLLGVVNDAVANVPYYSDRYRRPIHSLAEFKETFGFIDRNIVMSNIDAFVSRRLDKHFYDEGTTGGTSGKPLRLVLPKKRYQKEWAFLHSVWRNVGFDFDVRGVLRNHRFTLRKDFLVNPISKEVIFDNFRVDGEYAKTVRDVIRGQGIRYLHAYPSAAYQLFGEWCRAGIEVPQLKAVLTSSETIFDYQRELIERELGIRVYAWYGHSEKLVFAGLCRYSNDYHVEPAYGFFELMDEDGNPVNRAGRIGEIVGTGFDNFGMPLIRYRTGDVAEYVSDSCQLCGRKVPVIRNITGRWTGERLFNADDSYVTTTALNLHDDLYSVINGIQYYQPRKGVLFVNIIKGCGYRAEHETRLKRHYQERLSGCTIEIKYVDRLVFQKNGKFLQVVNDLN